MSAGMHSPLSQFEIKTLLPLHFGNIDLSFTNASLFMFTAVISSFLILTLPIKNMSVVPGRWQSIAEILYYMVFNTIKEVTGAGGLRYFPLVFTLFMFVLMCNLLGMVPYSFTVTSHIIVTFILAIIVFFAVTIIGFLRHGWHFLSLFAPSGISKFIVPFFIVIELLTYLARPITLSIRLAANMMAGHILLKVLAGFVIMMGAVWGFIPIPFIVIFTGVEIFVAILQAYIFTILTCVYLNDAVNLH